MKRTPSMNIKTGRENKERELFFFLLFYQWEKRETERKEKRGEESFSHFMLLDEREKQREFMLLSFLLWSEEERVWEHLAVGFTIGWEKKKQRSERGTLLFLLQEKRGAAGNIPKHLLQTERKRESFSIFLVERNRGEAREFAARERKQQRVQESFLLKMKWTEKGLHLYI